MPDQKNMANSSISTSDIEQMVRAANDLKQAFKDVNSELNKMNHALGKTTHSDNGDTNINVNVKGSSGSRSSSNSGSTARAQKKERSILDIFKSTSAGKGIVSAVMRIFKTGWAGAAIGLWTVFFKMVREMKKLAKELRQNLSEAQKDLAALGQSSKNLNTVLGNNIKTTTELNSKQKAFSTAIGALGNVINGALEKLVNWLADTIPALSKFIDQLEHATAGIARRQSVASATMSLVGQGMKYGTAQTTASNVEAAAVAYLMKAYGVDANAARNSDDYKATVQAMTSLVTSGGINGMFNTSNVEGYGYSNGIWAPGVQYTDQYMSAMRSQMLADALDIYKEGGAEGLADWNNQLSKIQLLVSNMAGSLYSFDEVEQVSAVNLEDLDTTVSNMGTADDITSNDDNNTNREIDAYADITDGGTSRIEGALQTAVETIAQTIADVEAEGNAQLQEELVTVTEALETALGLVAQKEEEGSTAVANGALAAAQSLANAANAAMTASANAITSEERAGYTTLASQLLSCSNAIIAAINAASASQLAIQQQASAAGLSFGSSSASAQAAAREVAGLSAGSTSSVAGVRHGSSSASAQAAAKEVARGVSDGSTLGAKSLDYSAVWKAYDDLAAYINRTAIYSDDYYRKDYLGQLKTGIQSLTTQQQIDNMAKAISEEKKRLSDFAKNGTADAIAEGLNGQNLPIWMQAVLGAGASVFGSLGLTGAAGALAGTGAVGSAIAGAAGAGSGVWSISKLIKDAMEVLGGSGAAFGGSYATGGIGLSEVRGATLFEDGPEAVLPLNDAGADFMAYTMQKALTQLGDVSTVNHGNTYNINGVKYLDQAVLDKMLLDDHDRTAQLVGRRGY